MENIELFEYQLLADRNDGLYLPIDSKVLGARYCETMNEVVLLISRGSVGGDDELFSFFASSQLCFEVEDGMTYLASVQHQIRGVTLYIYTS